MEAMQPWIAQEVTKYLGFEDEVVIGYIESQLEAKPVDPKVMQVSLLGFLEKNTTTFMNDLWSLLLSAQSHPTGIPTAFLDKKKEELKAKREEQARLEEAMKTKSAEVAARMEEERLRRAAIAAKAARDNEASSLADAAVPAGGGAEVEATDGVGDREGRDGGRRRDDRDRHGYERRDYDRRDYDRRDRDGDHRRHDRGHDYDRRRPDHSRRHYDSVRDSDRRDHDRGHHESHRHRHRHHDRRRSRSRERSRSRGHYRHDRPERRGDERSARSPPDEFGRDRPTLAPEESSAPTTEVAPPPPKSDPQGSDLADANGAANGDSAE